MGCGAGSVAHWDATHEQRLAGSTAHSTAPKVPEGTPPPHARDDPETPPLSLQPLLSTRKNGDSIAGPSLDTPGESRQELQEPATPPLTHERTVDGWSVASSPNGTSLQLVASDETTVSRGPATNGAAVNSWSEATYGSSNHRDHPAGFARVTSSSNGASGSSADTVEDAAVRAMEEAARVMAAATRSLSRVSSTPRTFAADGSAPSHTTSIKYSSPEAAIAKARALQAPLPDGWDAAVSRTTGQEYYINTLTGESTYDRPFVAARGSPLSTSQQRHDTELSVPQIPALRFSHDLLTRVPSAGGGQAASACSVPH